MKDIANAAIKLLEEGESFAQVTILAGSGSTPRKAGSCMLVREDGRIYGSVGGGSLEGSIIKAASEVIRSEKMQIIKVVLDGKDENAAGVICGGEATILVDYIDSRNPEHLEFFKSLLKALQSSDGHAYIFGAGHCGQKLAPVLSTVGFNVTVIDDRADYANRTRFPDADEIIVPVSMEDIFIERDFDKDSYIIIVTRGHAHDETVLRGALRTSACYIGMMGSKRKREAIYEHLLAEGFEQNDIDRV